MYIYPYASRQQSGANLLEVTGEATISAVPDQAVIMVGVITENTSPAGAQEQNNQTITAITSALLEAGLTKEQLQTSSYQLIPIYDFSEGKQILRGYQASHMLKVTIPDISQAGAVLSLAVQNGANNVSSIQFTWADPNDYYNKALTAAIRNAGNKAATITTGLGVPLHPIPVRIREAARNTAVPLGAKMLTSAAPVPLEPGELDITASVIVVYKYG